MTTQTLNNVIEKIFNPGGIYLPAQVRQRKITAIVICSLMAFLTIGMGFYIKYLVLWDQKYVGTSMCNVTACVINPTVCISSNHLVNCSKICYLWNLTFKDIPVSGGECYTFYNTSFPELNYMCHKQLTCNYAWSERLGYITSSLDDISYDLTPYFIGVFFMAVILLYLIIRSIIEISFNLTL